MTFLSDTMTLHRRAITIEEFLPGVDLCLMPAGISPDGRPPNLNDPPSLKPAVISISAIMLTLATLVLAGRLTVNRKSLKLSDWMMVVGFVFNVGFIVIQLLMVDRYRYIWDTRLCDILGEYMKRLFVMEIITGPALFFPKAAIFILYMQIFSTTRSLRIASIIGIIMAFLAYFPASLVLSYWNAPQIGHSWEELAINTHTHKGIPGGITIGVASVIVKIYIFILPLPTLVRLNMPVAKRIQVVSLFATAFLGIVASVVCLAYRVKLLWLKDPTWQAGLVAIPIIIENNVAIIVGSLPAFAAFLRKYVAQSSLYKSLRTRFSSSHHVSQSDWNNKEAKQTFGESDKQRKKLSYFELSDSSTMKSEITVPGVARVHGERDLEGGIVKTVGFERKEGREGSLDNLV